MTMCDVTQESTPSPMSPLSDLLPGSEMGGAGTGRNSVSPKPSISPLPPSDPAPPASELPSYSEATAAVDQTALTCVNEVRGTQWKESFPKHLCSVLAISYLGADHHF